MASQDHTALFLSERWGKVPRRWRLAGVRPERRTRRLLGLGDGYGHSTRNGDFRGGLGHSVNLLERGRWLARVGKMAVVRVRVRCAATAAAFAVVVHIREGERGS
uniref:Uncharacterized protein n=1 Tax=Arundo donax TaxID=35708 RepID=A0A0A9CWZ9_ARUDO